jgi:DNA-binding NarL/FixJ family response regulator
MKSKAYFFISADEGLLAHWRKISNKAFAFKSFDDFLKHFPSDSAQIWIDLQTPDLPPISATQWGERLKNPVIRWVATSSNPSDAEALPWLDAGFAGYCHAFADISTLRQIAQVVGLGHVWIGASLMQQLIHSAGRASKAGSPTSKNNWAQTLTIREQEIANLAAHGATNQAIATQCHISERTVKAHLSAIFDKLQITDRLQLALRVHGIQ